MMGALRIRRREDGFTLVELMVATTISLFLLIGIASLTASHSMSSRELEKTSRQIETGRYAMQVIGDELTLGGFFGPFTPKGATISTPDPCAIAVANLGFNNASSPITVAAPVYGYAPGAVAPTCLTNVQPNAGIVVVRRVTSSAIGVAAVAAGETYVQTTGCSTDPRPFVIDSNVASFTLHQKDCVAVAPLRKYVVRTYYVASCNVCSGPNADTTPTLKMAEFVGGAISITPLAEGVQDLKVDYGVDLDNNGSADCYVADPGADNSVTCAGWTAAPNWTAILQNWGNVVTVRLYILARNTEPTGSWTDTRTYDMGLAGTAGPFNDKYKRHVYSQIVRFSNVAGMREQ
jgi:type IV pilus assembly protein PilW